MISRRTSDRGNDITEALRKLEYKNTDNWNPVLKASTSLNEDEKGREDRHSKLQFKSYYGESQKLNMYYQDNQYKTYRLIWERYVMTMKAKIEAHKYFEGGIYNDPVEISEGNKVACI